MGTVVLTRDPCSLRAMLSVKWEMIRRALLVICKEFGLWERDPEDVGESRFGDISQTSLGADSRKLVFCDWAA